MPIQDRIQIIVEIIGKNLASFNKVMNQNMETFKQMRIQNVAFGNEGTRLADKIRGLTHGMRGFRMEMLGVMFFGMALQRTFMGLLRPTLELFGIFELWRVTLQVFFLPIVMLLFPWFLRLTEWLMDLNPETQKWIGALVILGMVLGTMLFIIGQFALGIGSIIQIWGLLGIGLVFAAVWLAILVGSFLAVQGVMKLAEGDVKGLSTALIGIGLILALFIGWWALIPIGIGLALGWAIDNVEGFKSLLEDVLNAIVANFEEDINQIIKAINFLIRQINRIPGINFGELGEISLGRFGGEMGTPLTAAPGYIGPRSPFEQFTGGGVTNNVNIVVADDDNTWKQRMDELLAELERSTST